MGDVINVYGDVSPRTAVYAYAGLLKRALPGIVTERSAQTKPVPKGKGKVVKFRRYLSLAAATTPLSEGVTPDGKKLTYEDVTVVLEQYGDYVIITDVIQDTHEDPVLQEAQTILAEQVQETRETLNIDVLKAGTNVYLANGALRTDVNTVITRGLLRKAVRYLKGQKAKFFTQILGASPNYSTNPIEAAFLAYAHPDLEADLRNTPGFIPVAEYGKPGSAFEYEVGTIENCRFILTTLFDPWASGGGAAGAIITSGGGLADVYPIIIVAQDAWATVPLRGGDSGQVAVVNPKPAAGDPLGQRGTAGWKFWHAAIILQELFMMRLEVAATLNPT